MIEDLVKRTRDLTDNTLDERERSLIIRGQGYAIVHITDPDRMAAAIRLVVKGYALAWGDEDPESPGLMLMRLTPAGRRLDI